MGKHTEHRKNQPQTEQRQSLAALLPPEILDKIFEPLLSGDFGASKSPKARKERRRDLSNASAVLEGWKDPARRVLFREVRIESWRQLSDSTLEEWGGELVRELEISAGYSWGAIRTPEEVASAVFKLLERLPNLRCLRLANLQFDSFNPTDSASMQSTVLLPHLHELHISYSPSPHSVISDLLATSNHQISRLKLTRGPRSTDERPERPQLDFRGNLRYLSADEGAYQTLLDPARANLDGLAGVEELDLVNVRGEMSERDGEFFRVVAPTLRTLSIDARKASWLKNTDAPLPQLSRLSIMNRSVNLAPFLHCLPPTLSSLHFSDDQSFRLVSALWAANPALVPASLKSIGFNDIYDISTFTQFPRIRTLCTGCTGFTVDYLGRLAPDTLPFTTLEIWFPDWQLDKLSVVQAECARLGVEFRQREAGWNASFSAR